MNTFNFQGTQLRTIEIDEVPWFHAADACRCIGVYIHSTTGQPNLTLLKRRMGAEDFMLAPLTVGKGSRPNLISESGLYKLIMRSDKPEARVFQDWVTREVLPAIRRTGGYLLNEHARETASEAPLSPSGRSRHLPQPLPLQRLLRASEGPLRAC